MIRLCDINVVKKMQVPLILNVRLGDIHVKGVLKHRVCHFMGGSGTGKTFLFSLIAVYCMQKKFRCITINHNQAQQPAAILLLLCANADVVLLDDADLYDYKAVIKELRHSPCIVLVSHHEMLLPADGEAGNSETKLIPHHMGFWQRNLRLSHNAMAKNNRTAVAE